MTPTYKDPAMPIAVPTPPTQDLAKPGHEILVDLINKDNQTDYSYDDLSFSRVQAIPGGDPYNTSVDVSHVTRSGSVTVEYNRLSLTQFFAGVSVEVPEQGYLDIVEALAEVNSRFGLLLDETHVQNEDLSFIESYPHTVTVYAQSDSLCYLDSFELTITEPPAA